MIASVLSSSRPIFSRLTWVSLCLAVFSLVWAAGTPADTRIQNQASAEYIDSADQPRSTTSNLVVTVVQQVFDFTITPNSLDSSGNPTDVEANVVTFGQSRSALPEAPVYFNYIVANTGNGTDTINLSTAEGAADAYDFTGVETIYLDDNCNGTVDPGEVSVTSVVLDADTQACLIVEAVVPASSLDGDAGNLNLSGQSQGDVSKTDGDNWARAYATNAGALTVNKSASPNGAVDPGQIVTYTLSGSNVGGSAAGEVTNVIILDTISTNGIVITDILPASLTYIGNPTFSAGAGTLTFIYTSDSGATWQQAQPASVAGVGLLIQGTGAFFPQTASYTLSFDVQVPLTAAQGTSYDNAATLKFDGNGNGNATDPGETVESNHVQHSVNGLYGVAVGPFQYPEAAASGNYTVDGFTHTRAADDTSSASTVYSGETVVFQNTVKNLGNGSDSFDLAVSGAPAGWVCQVYQADGSTPLSAPVGPLAAGDSYDVYVKCLIPTTYTNAAADQLTLTATSVGDPVETDTTTDTVSAVQNGYAVNIGNSNDADVTTVPSDTSVTLLGDAGTVVTFPLELQNDGANTDTFELSYTAPAGWNVSFYEDATCDGTPDGAPITNSGLINADDGDALTPVDYNACYLAAVSVPAGQPSGDQNVTFTATSTSDASKTDSITDTVTVNQLRAITFDPDRSGTVTSPGTVVYSHTLSNLSNDAATVDIPAFASAYGWTYQLSTDGTSWSSDLTGIALAPGAQQDVFVRVITPAGEPVGRTEAATFTATATYTGGTATASVTDTTTIVSGDLRLSKTGVSYVGSTATVRSADASQAYPLDEIEYHVIADNIGTGVLKQVIIADPLPAYTDFVSLSATTTIDEDGIAGADPVYYSLDGATWTNNPASLSPVSGQVIYVAVDTTADGNITSADVMPAGTQLDITLRVRVQ